MWIKIVIFLRLIQMVLTTNQDLEQVFHERTESDWQQHWHRETYSKCRNNIVRHLFWACEKDIYKMTRRSRDFTVNEDVQRFKKDDIKELNIWETRKTAWMMLRTRRNSGNNLSKGHSITQECCNRKGCTWEEYAEYCPSNKRLGREK